MGRAVQHFEAIASNQNPTAQHPLPQGPLDYDRLSECQQSTGLNHHDVLESLRLGQSCVHKRLNKERVNEAHMLKQIKKFLQYRLNALKRTSPANQEVMVKFFLMMMWGSTCPPWNLTKDDLTPFRRQLAEIMRDLNMKSCELVDIKDLLADGVDSDKRAGVLHLKTATVEEIE